MDNNKDGNYKSNTKFTGINNLSDSKNNDKMIFVDNNERQIYRRGDDDNNKITEITTHSTINPFAASMDMWQSYLKGWTDLYKQLFLKNLSITNGEFLFMYCNSF